MCPVTGHRAGSLRPRHAIGGCPDARREHLAPRRLIGLIAHSARSDGNQAGGRRDEPVDVGRLAQTRRRNELPRTAIGGPPQPWHEGRVSVADRHEPRVERDDVVDRQELVVGALDLGGRELAPALADPRPRFARLEPGDEHGRRAVRRRHGLAVAGFLTEILRHPR